MEQQHVSLLNSCEVLSELLPTMTVESIIEAAAGIGWPIEDSRSVMEELMVDPLNRSVATRDELLMPSRASRRRPGPWLFEFTGIWTAPEDACAPFVLARAGRTASGQMARTAQPALDHGRAGAEGPAGSPAGQPPERRAQADVCGPSPRSAR